MCKAEKSVEEKIKLTRFQRFRTQRLIPALARAVISERLFFGVSSCFPACDPPPRECKEPAPPLNPWKKGKKR